MTTPSLFDGWEDPDAPWPFPPVPADPRTLARAGDPATSVEAAERIAGSVGELQRWAAECVRLTPGKTARELAAIYCPTDPRKIGRRLNECVGFGMVRKGEARVCSVSGSKAATWYPVEEG